jgi:hypothetical protein|eukprot:COSAG06_NODE_2912_length_6101_cov_280.856215_6_plen_41_part_00
MSLYKCLKLTGFDDIRHENAIFAPFTYENDDFTKTGSGQT